MFDINVIKSELNGLVGFKQPANPKYANIDADNQISQSGLFVTDNPYAKIEYLRDNHDYARVSDVQFNNFLRDLKKTSIIKVCQSVFIEPDYLDRNLIYSNGNNKVTEFQLPVGFVGYKIKIDEKKSVAFRINRAILEFVADGNLDLLVFNSNLKTPIHTVSIAYDDYYHIEDVDLVCNDSGYYKGTFYVGYINTNKRTYKRDFEDSSLQNKLTCLEISQIKVDDVNVATIFDQSKVEGLEDYCGFNLDITVVDDFTDMILNNKYLFSRAIYIETVIAALNVYCSSLRSNSGERNADDLYARVMLEIEGTRPDDNVVHVRGLRPEMLFEISQIREELLKLKHGLFTIGYNVDTQD
jgi:hypothetical protein